MDGQTWHPYIYRHQTPSLQPNVSPHLPRLDFLLFYSAHAISMPSSFSWLNPFRGHGNITYIDRIAQRLLEGAVDVTRLFSERSYFCRASQAGSGGGGKLIPTFIRVTKTIMAPSKSSKTWCVHLYFICLDTFFIGYSLYLSSSGGY